MQNNLEKCSVMIVSSLLEVILRPSVLYFFHFLHTSVPKYSDLGGQPSMMSQRDLIPPEVRDLNPQPSVGFSPTLKPTCFSPFPNM